MSTTFFGHNTTNIGVCQISFVVVSCCFLLPSIGDIMNQIPKVLYTKCFKHELAQHSHTLGAAVYGKNISLKILKD